MYSAITVVIATTQHAVHIVECPPKYKEAPPAVGRRNSITILLMGYVLGLLALVWSMLILFGPFSRIIVWMVDARQLDGWSYHLAWLGPSTVLVLGCLACFQWVKYDTTLPLAELLRRDRPLWMVYLTILLFAVFAAPIGGEMHAIVLLHVRAWWIFVSFGMAELDKEPRAQKLRLGMKIQLMSGMTSP